MEAKPYRCRSCLGLTANRGRLCGECINIVPLLTKGRCPRVSRIINELTREDCREGLPRAIVHGAVYSRAMREAGR